MVGIFKVADLEARKRALGAESDMYRQMIRLELHNLDLYANRMQRKAALFLAHKPLVALGAPLAGSLFGKRQNKWMRLAEAGVAGWQLFRKFAPMIRQRFPFARGRNPMAPHPSAD